MSAIVNGSSARPERPMPRLSKTIAVEARLEPGEEGAAPGEVGGAHPLDQQHRLALAGALVVQLGPRGVDARHRRRSYAFLALAVGVLLEFPALVIRLCQARFGWVWGQRIVGRQVSAGEVLLGRLPSAGTTALERNGIGLPTKPGRTLSSRLPPRGRIGSTGPGRSWSWTPGTSLTTRPLAALDTSGWTRRERTREDGPGVQGRRLPSL